MISFLPALQFASYIFSGLTIVGGVLGAVAYSKFYNIDFIEGAKYVDYFPQLFLRGFIKDAVLDPNKEVAEAKFLFLAKNFDNNVFDIAMQALEVADAGYRDHLIHYVLNDQVFLNKDNVDLNHKIAKILTVYETKLSIKEYSKIVLASSNRPNGLGLLRALNDYAADDASMGKNMLSSIVDDEGNNLIHRAINAGISTSKNMAPTYETINFLIENYKYLLDSPNIHGILPIHMALSCGDKTLIKMIMKVMDNVNHPDSSGNAPIAIIIDQKPDLLEVIKDEPDIIKKIDFSVKADGVKTLLDSAVKTKKTDVIEFVLQNLPKNLINEIGIKGRPYIHDAVANKDKDLFELFEKYGADINVQTPEGSIIHVYVKTKLSEDIESNDTKFLDFLLSKMDKKTVELKDSNGKKSIEALLDGILNMAEEHMYKVYHKEEDVINYKAQLDVMISSILDKAYNLFEKQKDGTHIKSSMFKAVEPSNVIFNNSSAIGSHIFRLDLDSSFKKFLIKNKDLSTIKGPYGEPLIFPLIAKGDVEMLDIALKAGCKIDTGIWSGLNSIQSAILKSAAITEYLLEQKIAKLPNKNTKITAGTHAGVYTIQLAKEMFAAANPELYKKILEAAKADPGFSDKIDPDAPLIPVAHLQQDQEISQLSGDIQGANDLHNTVHIDNINQQTDHLLDNQH